MTPAVNSILQEILVIDRQKPIENQVPFIVTILDRSDNYHDISIVDSRGGEFENKNSLFPYFIDHFLFYNFVSFENFIKIQRTIYIIYNMFDGKWYYLISSGKRFISKFKRCRKRNPYYYGLEFNKMIHSLMVPYNGLFYHDPVLNKVLFNPNIFKVDLEKELNRKTDHVYFHRSSGMLQIQFASDWELHFPVKYLLYPDLYNIDKIRGSEYHYKIDWEKYDVKKGLKILFDIFKKFSEVYHKMRLRVI